MRYEEHDAISVYKDRMVIVNKKEYDALAEMFHAVWPDSTSMEKITRIELRSETGHLINAPLVVEEEKT